MKKEYDFSKEQLDTVRTVAEKYKISFEAAEEYIDEWIVEMGSDSPWVMKLAIRSSKIMYLYKELNMTVPVARESLRDLQYGNGVYNITAELPGTIWTLLYGFDLSLQEARKIYRYYKKYMGTDDFTSECYHQFLFYIEDGESMEDAMCYIMAEYEDCDY